MHTKIPENAFPFNVNTTKSARHTDSYPEIMLLGTRVFPALASNLAQNR